MSEQSANVELLQKLPPGTIVFKDGVRIAGMQPAVGLAITTAARLFEMMNSACIVISINDGKHGGSKPTLHYSGCAVDCLAEHLSPGDTAELIKLLKVALGEEFDVVNHATKAPVHIHIKWQPKR